MKDADKLWLLGCAHYGEESQDQKTLAKYIKMAADEGWDWAVCGDAFDIGMCFGTKHVGSVWNNYLSPREQIDAFNEDFDHIKKQCKGFVTGNHENRSEQLNDINPLRVLADRMRVPYFGASKILKWNGKNVFIAHGSTGGLMTDFNKVLATYEGLDAVVLAHTHQLSATRTRRFSVDRAGHTTERTIELARCGSFLKDAAYAKFALHPPTPIGSAILCLQKDGSLKVQLGI